MRTFALACLTLSTFSAHTLANTITLSAVKDNTIYFNTLAVSNGGGQFVFSGTNGVGQPLRGLMKFDLAANIPAGSTINSVQLVLTMSQAIAHTASNIQLRRLSADWGESTTDAANGEGTGGLAATGDATWQSAFHPSTPWSTQGGSFSATISAVQIVGNNGTHTWASTPTLVADAQSFLDATGGNFGWLLFNTNESITPSAKRFVSRTGFPVNSRPRLIVDFTPPITIAHFCFGDGSGTPCPCGGSGSSGNGCPNSAVSSGALLNASGGVTLASDTLVLTALNMPNATAIYFQGTAPVAAGLGNVLGDGLWCVGGSLVRLAVKANAGGISSFPGAGDPSVSAAGLVTAPGTRYYQVWYADTAAFCTSDTFNFTNAANVSWN